MSTAASPGDRSSLAPSASNLPMLDVLGLVTEQPQHLPAGVDAYPLSGAVALVCEPKQGVASGRMALLSAIAAMCDPFVPLTRAQMPITSLASWFETHRATLSSSFVRLSECREYVISFYEKLDPTPISQQENWLRGRAATFRQQSAVRCRLVAVAEKMRDALEDITHEQRIAPFQKKQNIGMDLAILISNDKAYLLSKRFTSSKLSDGISARLSGPWPCLSFVPSDLAEVPQ